MYAYWRTSSKKKVHGLVWTLIRSSWLASIQGSMNVQRALGLDQNLTRSSDGHMYGPTQRHFLAYYLGIKYNLEFILTWNVCG
jgi:hypothetical protein